MTSTKSIIGIMAVLTVLSSCSEMTECAMETMPAPPAVKKASKHRDSMIHCKKTSVTLTRNPLSYCAISVNPNFLSVQICSNS